MPKHIITAEGLIVSPLTLITGQQPSRLPALTSLARTRERVR